MIEPVHCYVCESAPPVLAGCAPHPLHLEPAPTSLNHDVGRLVGVSPCGELAGQELRGISSQRLLDGEAAMLDHGVGMLFVKNDHQIREDLVHARHAQCLPV